MIVRGIEKKPIFLDDQDRGSFLDRLSTLLQETETNCYGWALLSNYLSVRVLGYKGLEIGKMLCLGAAGVSIAARRGEVFLKENHGLKEKIISTINKRKYVLYANHKPLNPTNIIHLT